MNRLQPEVAPMLQLQALHDYLPRGYAVELEDEQLTVRCPWCGWELVKRCGAYHPVDVLERVYLHHTANHPRDRRG